MSRPSHQWPTVRCWTKASLNRLFAEVKSEIGEAQPEQSNLSILRWIEQLGLSCTIPAESVEFRLFEIGAGADSPIDPYELLMAYSPAGVICYFGAISFHSLTSQIPSHYHVAVMQTVQTPAGQSNEKASTVTAVNSMNRIEHPDRGSSDDMIGELIESSQFQTDANGDQPGGILTGDLAKAKPNPLGKKIFSVSEVSYYLTRRQQRLVPGVQNVSNGPRGQIRITTYEQTLLDTLIKPTNCGGPAVAMEAWQNSIAGPRLNEKRLVDYLMRMEYPATSRRLGAILKVIDHAPGKELTRYLDHVKQKISGTTPPSEISLFPGYSYSQLDTEWLVRVP